MQLDWESMISFTQNDDTSIFNLKSAFLKDLSFFIVVIEYKTLQKTMNEMQWLLKYFKTLIFYAIQNCFVFCKLSNQIGIKYTLNQNKKITNVLQKDMKIFVNLCIKIKKKTCD